MADGIPMYVLKNQKKGRKKLLHQACLLLWFAKEDGEPLRINCITINSSLTGAKFATPLHQNVQLGMVPHWLIYCLSIPMFETRAEPPILMTGNSACKVLVGYLGMEQATGFTVREGKH